MATVYYVKNVKYPVGVRMNANDSIGKLLVTGNDWIAVPDEGLRDFKLANKRAILEGLIVEGSEPNTDWVTPNALTEDDMKALVGNYLKLKQSLQDISSPPIIEQLLEIAKVQNRPQKTLSLIQARLDELAPDEEDFVNVREALDKQ